MTSSQFSVGLVALQAPIGENPPVAATTAWVEFDEPLPTHAVSTHRRIFEAAEKVFRETRRLLGAEIGIRESSLPQAVSDASIHAGRGPDGVCQGARVWLSAM